MDELTASNLLKDARAAAVAGDRDEAVRLTRQALDAYPDDEKAWLLLAAFLDDPEEKRQAVKKALAIDPFNEEAKAALAKLNGDQDHVHEGEVGSETLYCANHPTRETMLRCNRCNKPICMECAVQTPVGYRCRECVRQQQDKFYTAETSDQTKGYIAGVVSGFILGIAALILNAFLGGFFGWIIALFVGPILGGALSEVIWRATGRKRARNFGMIVTVIVVGIAGVMTLGNMVFFRGLPITAAIIIFTAASAIFARLR
ncbi:MAG: tetratricopeptide repeat protein [Caldilineales bacterium]|nr:tetratricopeptide repeat protein [Caldilineales bacterium]